VEQRNEVSIDNCDFRGNRLSLVASVGDHCIGDREEACEVQGQDIDTISMASQVHRSGNIISPHDHKGGMGVSRYECVSSFLRSFVCIVGSKSQSDTCFAEDRTRYRVGMRIAASPVDFRIFKMNETRPLAVENL